jgi:hypothetical protein
MKNMILLFLLFLISCKSSIEKSNEELDSVILYQKKINYLLTFPEFRYAANKAKEDFKKGEIVFIGEIPNAWYDSRYIKKLSRTKDSFAAQRLELINQQQMMLVLHKELFLNEVKNISDPQEQIELIKKLDNFYILNTLY